MHISMKQLSIKEGFLLSNKKPLMIIFEKGIPP
jgi:hypothetical protein